jgi:peptidoglycan hydrolase CwlO-like protein
MSKVTDEMGMELHDRFTQDQPLTPDEMSLLETWYAQQDSAESMLLNQPLSSLPNLVSLQHQVDATLEQLISVTQRIQQVSGENDELRREIAVLQQQLTVPRSA